MKKKPRSYEKKKRLYGLAFMIPWMIGFIFLYLQPAITSFIYSVNRLKFEAGGVELTHIGFEVYREILEQDAWFYRSLINALTSMAYQVPLTVFFSLFIAVVINQKFRGRTTARALFFLPVIVASGVVMYVIKGDSSADLVLGGSADITKNAMLSAEVFRSMMVKAQINSDIITFFMTLTNNIFEVVWKSGLQILIFLGGLQTIPTQLYEASSLEGATAWENFWKVTFPLISPILILNVVYSIIDSFTDIRNPVVSLINRYSTTHIDFTMASAMTWVYTVIIVVVILIIYRLINKRVFYMVD